MKKILICDDSPTEIINMAKILEQAGCQVIKAGNGKEAIKKAKKYRPDLIFLDIVMPEMDGFAACRELTNSPETKNLPVVFVSSKGQKADRLWAQMQGAKDLIQKPYQDTDLINHVKAV
ncbi:MAG: response regulator [Gammaproteobacteria bacterium]|nr:response regulator [Gammaproteobacteria bacterium]